MLFSGFVLVLTIASTWSVHLHLFYYRAELVRSISPYELPLTFTDREWPSLSPDSFRLIGDHLQVQGRTITYHPPSLNGQSIFIQRATDSQTWTPALMIDESRNFIQDLSDQTYYTIDPSRIRYASVLPAGNYTVDFTFSTSHVEPIYVRYRVNHLNWKARYDLVLSSNASQPFLQAYADIRNGGTTSFLVETAQLINDDTQSVVYKYSQETFQLPARSTYTLPMFRSTVTTERFAIVDKFFSSIDNRGRARRGYRLYIPNHDLPLGDVSIYESNRSIGDSSWPTRLANSTYQLQTEEDSDLQYEERIQLIRRRQLNGTNQDPILLSTYRIQLRLINRKSQPIVFEYRLRFLSQDYLTLVGPAQVQREGSQLIGKIKVAPNNQGQQIVWTVEMQPNN